MRGFAIGLAATVLALTIGPPAFAGQRNQSTAEAIYQKVADSVVLLLVENEAHETIGQGSGFVIEGGRIITNAHVARAGTVFVKSGVFKAKCDLLRLDEADDLALLSLSTPIEAPPLPLAAGVPPSGGRIFAIGNPRGLEKTITEGLVTGIRNIDGKERLQISAAISPGSSGGPIVDESGAVVGVAVSGLTNAQNLNFAVPVTALPKLLAARSGETFDSVVASIGSVAAARDAAQFSMASVDTQNQQLIDTSKPAIN